jgi:hypothetical protein
VGAAAGAVRWAGVTIDAERHALRAAAAARLELRGFSTPYPLLFAIYFLKVTPNLLCDGAAAMVTKVGGKFGTLRHPHLIVIQPYLAYYDHLASHYGGPSCSPILVVQLEAFTGT